MKPFTFQTAKPHARTEYVMTDYLYNHLPDHLHLQFNLGDYAEILDMNTRKTYGATAYMGDDIGHYRVEFEFIH